ncbi:hypothetical protein GUJ93_ZPchr0008g11464 [Zizania palustris]|uniref:F-box domain-containing protein n=1 Tax=Zizania palustris TaxID=103762 RepID=A0A8J5VIX4_ZIZPA|nr:hypothetical protein GUJ93_ZPchr0008g11464 [Zizania palustris]KAG8045904.1 hypothetical protein GUJ93_ZPchr0008g11464 [Zizania palustris]
MSAKVPRLLEVNSTGMADWASLQTDILGVIVKKLAIPDYLRFRAVCTSWNIVCRDVSNYPRMDPWLMLPANALDGSKFLCVHERKNQTIHLPSTATIFGSMWVPVGCSHGWLIFYSPSHGTMQLINPISGAQFQLPPIGRRSFSKAMLLDMNDTDFTVAVIFHDQKGYKVTRKGSNSWSSVESKHDLVDVFKHRRQLYTIDIYGTVELWAEPPRAWADEDAPQMIDPHHNHNFIHYPQHGKLNCLVESPAGDLMRVKRRSNDKFVVWILDKGTFSWEKVDNIGDFALFVSYYSSVCLRSRGYLNLKANCVYFIDSYSNLCAFNLENRTKELVQALEPAHALGHPEPHAVRRRPEGQRYMWLIPSLR